MIDDFYDTVIEGPLIWNPRLLDFQDFYHPRTIWTPRLLGALEYVLTLFSN